MKAAVSIDRARSLIKFLNLLAAGQINNLVGPLNDSDLESIQDPRAVNFLRRLQSEVVPSGDQLSERLFDASAESLDLLKVKCFSSPRLPLKAATKACHGSLTGVGRGRDG